MSDSIKIFHKGKNVNEDFLIWGQSVEAIEKFRKDPGSLPLVEVVGQFKIYITHNQGSQGVYDEAPNSQLDNEFGTHKEDEVIKQILLHGEIHGNQKVIAKGDKFSSKNDGQFGGR